MSIHSRLFLPALAWAVQEALLVDAHVALMSRHRPVTVAWERAGG